MVTEHMNLHRIGSPEQDFFFYDFKKKKGFREEITYLYVPLLFHNWTETKIVAN